MLQKNLLKLFVALGVVYSSSAMASKLPTPKEMCYWNCTDAGYTHNQCLKACYVNSDSSIPEFLNNSNEENTGMVTWVTEEIPMGKAKYQAWLLNTCLGLAGANDH